MEQDSSLAMVRHVVFVDYCHYACFASLLHVRIHVLPSSIFT